MSYSLYENIIEGTPVSITSGKYKGKTGVFKRWPNTAKPKSAYILINGARFDVRLLLSTLHFDYSWVRENTNDNNNVNAVNTVEVANVFANEEEVPHMEVTVANAVSADAEVRHLSDGLQHAIEQTNCRINQIITENNIRHDEYANELKQIWNCMKEINDRLQLLLISELKNSSNNNNNKNGNVIEDDS